MLLAAWPAQAAVSPAAWSLASGPVPSRRLGRSLGVNNVPYKTCPYSCIYCQLGRTTNLTVERRCFYDWGCASGIL
jgi:wyosine [tRNA(Phe)-imidazoG37] synthetase (radical SAM superfamily)